MEEAPKKPEVYTPEKTASLIQSAKAYSRHPGADFIRSIADQLVLAETHVNAMAAELRTTQNNLTLVTNQRNDEEVRHRQTRDRLTVYATAIEQIAKGVKNPKKLAAETINPPVPDVAQPAV